MRAFALLSCLLAALFAAPAALADPVPVGAAAYVNVNLLTVSAYAGRSNDIVVSRDATGWWVTETSGLAMSPATGCGHVSGQPTSTVRCTGGITNLRVNLGDWDDELVITANVRSDVNGGDGNDTITGGPGQDFMEGGFGNDVITGGASMDTVHYQTRTAPVRVSNDGAANDGQTGEYDNVGTDVENLWGGQGEDTIHGNDQANWLYGLGGWDWISGRAGDDLIDGGDGNDTMDGGTGGDDLTGGNGTGDTVDYSSRTAYVSVWLDSSSNDGEYGEGDFVSLTTENITGGSAGDVLAGSSVRNVLRGGPGNDALLGYGGDDALLGEAGGDSLYGGEGDDWMPGDAYGTLVGTDTVDGGPGFDSTGYEGRANAVYVFLDGVANDGQPSENDQLVGVESVVGGNGNDAFVGSVAAETLSGGNGADYLDGDGGADVLRGGSGEDTIYGFDGDDTLDGGSGVDDLDGEAGSDRCEAADGGARAGCERPL